MGIQTMATQGGGGGGGGGGGHRSQIQSLARQGSLYSLTLNEVQTHLGEPLHSMNLEELLKGLDAEQSVAVDGPAAAVGRNQYASGSGIHRQGSLTMPRGLVKKTVEEVWREIQQGTNRDGEGRRGGQERQPTLGEMTLEDFLAKAGVMPEGGGSGKGRSSAVGAAPPPPQGSAHWLYQQMPAVDQHGMMVAYLPGRGGQPAMGGGSNQMLEVGYPEEQMSLSPPQVGAMSDSQTPGRKRGHSGDVADKMVERRQKRMIKNRESAARSRARKQAYTNELENKVSRLEEENERLKKQKELDKILYVPPPEPKYQLRRTSSASF